MSILTTYISVPIFQLAYMMSDEKKSFYILSYTVIFFLKNSVPTLEETVIISWGLGLCLIRLYFLSVLIRIDA